MRLFEVNYLQFDFQTPAFGAPWFKIMNGSRGAKKAPNVGEYLRFGKKITSS